MADSDITVNGLVATSGIGEVTITWSAPVDPYRNGGLPYLQLDVIEIWSSSLNDRAYAQKIGEQSTGTIFVESGLDIDVSRYYWLRPRNQAGSYGDWHPLSETEGVAATPVGVDSADEYDLSTVGYYKNLAGLNQQWGQISTDEQGLGSGEWPEAYAQLLHFMPVVIGVLQPVPIFVSILSANLDEFSIFTFTLINGVVTPVSATVHWFAIGVSEA